MPNFRPRVLSPKADAALFVVVLLLMGAAFVAIYPSLTTTDPSDSWTAVQDTEPTSDAPERPLRGTGGTDLPQALQGNMLDGIPAPSSPSGSRFTVPDLSTSQGNQHSRGSASRSNTQARSSWNPGSGIASSGGPSWSGASSSRAQGSASSGSSGGGWARELAASSGELRTLERQVGAIHERASRQFGPSPEEHAASAHGHDALEGAFASGTEAEPQNDPVNPPLPPDPIPVDGGLPILVLLGVAYAGWRLYGV